MTSSLVGSEMCIRDRCHRNATETGHPQRPARGGCMAFIGGFPDKTPVSYTHLTLPTICSV
eukprot:1925133-Prorocentrum_lima.AAC.1